MNDSPHAVGHPILESNPRSIGMFLITELFVFFSQIINFLAVAAFSSNFLQDESHLVQYAEAKLNPHTLPDIGLHLLAITMVIGLTAFVARVASSPVVETILDEVLKEAPRTIYFFGSTVTATIFAVAIFLAFHPEAANNAREARQYFGMSLLSAGLTFVYGCGLNYLLMRAALKRHIAESVRAEADLAHSPGERRST
jgi:hypothetical protein